MLLKRVKAHAIGVSINFYPCSIPSIWRLSEYKNRKLTLLNLYVFFVYLFIRNMIYLLDCVQSYK